MIAVDIKSGSEKWVTQLNEGDIYNHTMSGYDPNTGRYKDCSVGDTPKIYSIESDGGKLKVVGVGCKNGGFYVLGASDGKLLANTPVFDGKPEYPLDPQPDPRMIALPSPIGGIQTGCATDGKNVFTNGIDWLLLNTKHAGITGRRPRRECLGESRPRKTGGIERPNIRSLAYNGGDPVASGIALGRRHCLFYVRLSRNSWSCSTRRREKRSSKSTSEQSGADRRSHEAASTLAPAASCS